MILPCRMLCGAMLLSAGILCVGMSSAGILSADMLLAAPQELKTGSKPAAPPQEDRAAKPSDESPTEAQDDFYDPAVVQSVHLEVAEADQRRMLAALPECIYVPAAFRWRDTTIKKVAIRFKGNSSSHPQQQHKRSYLVKFSKYDDDQRFLGLRRVSFDNGVQFGSLISEPIITDILRDLGITTHRANYARVYLNGKYQGVYVNVERIDESFISRHFPGSGGSLWKNDLGGPGGDLRFIGDNPQDYRAFEPKNKGAKENGAQLVEFIKRINQADRKDFAVVLQRTMEVDDFLRTTAVMLFSGAFDQLTGWGPHNYYLYHDAKQNRWRYLPWDLDVGFCEIAFGRVHVLADWHAAWPVPAGRNNPLLDRIVADPALLARYRQMAAEILEQHFQPDQLCRLIDGKYQLIKADLQTDPFPHQRVTVPGDRGYDDIVESIKTFVRKRYPTAREQLANPGQRPEARRRPEQQLPPGVPAELAVRLQTVMQRAQQMQRQVGEIQRIMQHVGPLLQQGKVAEAEQLIDRALKLTE